MEAEQFVVDWTRAEPAPTGLYARGGALYQRNDPMDPVHLAPSAHVNFEELNKLESESDFYIARYKDSQNEALNKAFEASNKKL